MIPDIEIVIDFKAECGQDISIPAYDFVLKFFTTTKSVEVKQTNGVLTSNAKVCADGKLHVFLDSPSLGSGDLFREAKLLIPDENFPDGIRASISTRRVGRINLLYA